MNDTNARHVRLLRSVLQDVLTELVAVSGFDRQDEIRRALAETEPGAVQPVERYTYADRKISRDGSPIISIERPVLEPGPLNGWTVNMRVLLPHELDEYGRRLVALLNANPPEVNDK